MKEKCDNHCETCPMQSQVFCALIFAKANNSAIGSLAQRVENVERVFQVPQISVKPSDAIQLDENLNTKQP